MTIAAIIVAAGRGLRAGGGDTPKQFQLIGGAPVLSHTLKAFARQSTIDKIIVVIHPDYEALAAEAISCDLLSEWPDLDPIVVHGGDTRQKSVFEGLKAVRKIEPEYVLIHDAARPFITGELCDLVIEALKTHDGALPALGVADTLKRVVSGPDGATSDSIETVDRGGLYGAQTPQGFRFGAILDAHQAAAQSDQNNFTDDESIAEWHGLSLTLVEGIGQNRKITTADDLKAADQHLKYEARVAKNTENIENTENTDNRGNQGQQFEYRTGSGFDVHRLCEGDHVILCGVKIHHAYGLKGHSDADVGMHALTDALLGAIGEGDIGSHFPPSDIRWKGAASDKFLSHAKELVAVRSAKIIHVDVTLICEAPKIGPHRAAMIAQLSEILEITEDRISIKATTTEGLGFAGRREGIASMASATIALPL